MMSAAANLIRPSQPCLAACTEKISSNHKHDEVNRHNLASTKTRAIERKIRMEMRPKRVGSFSPASWFKPGLINLLERVA
jgi:hypothetical protein